MSRQPIFFTRLGNSSGNSSQQKSNQPKPYWLTAYLFTYVSKSADPDKNEPQEYNPNFFFGNFENLGEIRTKIATPVLTKEN